MPNNHHTVVTGQSNAAAARLFAVCLNALECFHVSEVLKSFYIYLLVCLMMVGGGVALQVCSSTHRLLSGNPTATFTLMAVTCVMLLLVPPIMVHSVVGHPHSCWPAVFPVLRTAVQHWHTPLYNNRTPVYSNDEYLVGGGPPWVLLPE